MDCFSDDYRSYEIVLFTPKKCKPYVDAMMKKNIRFTNPYEVANYFFVLHTNAYKGFEEIDLIFVKMNKEIYYFKNENETLLRFTSEECAEEWYPPVSKGITKDHELYAVLSYVSPNVHLIFQPRTSRPGCFSEIFDYSCITNENLWKVLQRSKKEYVICSKVMFLSVFGTKNILEQLSIERLCADSKGSISVMMYRESPLASTKLIPGIPKYLVTKDGKVYGEGMKLIKHKGDKDQPYVDLRVKGVQVSYAIKNLIASAWGEDEVPLEDIDDALLEYEAPLEDVDDDLPLEEEMTRDYLNQTEESLGAFIGIFTKDTWFEEVSKIIESNHETKKYFLSFLKSFSSIIPKNEALQSAINTTKYEPLISLLDSEPVPFDAPVIYNIFGNV